MTEHSALPREVALRVGLAVREVPGIDLAVFISALLELSGGELTLDGLNRIGPKRLREALKETSPVSHSAAHRAIECLRLGKGAPVALGRVPAPDEQPLLEPALRVAFCSSEGRLLDAGFSACRRFLIYDVGKTHERLVAVRCVAPSQKTQLTSGETLQQRLELVRDCSILYTLSIGTPAAAMVVREKVHPVRLSRVSPAAHVIGRLRQVLRDSPPPWMSKALGAGAP